WRGAVSSVGRAPALQAGGRWFEPGTAHLIPQANPRLRRCSAKLIVTGRDFSDQDLHRLLAREACGFECMLLGCKALGSFQKRTRNVDRPKTQPLVEQRQIGRR